jgi:hypothetical protein
MLPAEQASDRYDKERHYESSRQNRSLSLAAFRAAT